MASVVPSLEALGVSSCALLLFTGSGKSNCLIPHISSVSITNEVVLELHSLMSRHSSCTYKTLYEWLSALHGEVWPQPPPTIKSITQSVKHLLARFEKLKKLPSSTEKTECIKVFLSDPYTLPRIFVAKGKVHNYSESSMSECVSSCEDVENDTLKAVNKDLCSEVAELKSSNETLKEADHDIKVLCEKFMRSTVTRTKTSS